MKEDKKIARVGDKYMLKCGVEVEIVEIISNKDVLVTDGKAFKNCRFYNLVKGGVAWIVDGILRTAYYTGNVKKCEPPVKVGEIFKLNCGVSVSIKEYLGSDRVLVEDEHQNLKNVSLSSLRKGHVSWLGKTKTEVNRPPVEINIGDVFSSKRFGEFEIIGYSFHKKNLFNVRFKNSGGAMWNVSAVSILKGTLSDRSKEHVFRNKPYRLGGRFYSTVSGWCTVIDLESSTNITVQWDHTGNIQKTSYRTLKKTTFCENVKESPLFEPKGHYVYIAKTGGEIVYIGSGKEQRYMHCIDGRSSNYDLNRLHFSKYKVEVEIFKEGLTKREALDLELSLIRKHNPICNISGKSD
jgi:hypothetical protein